MAILLALLSLALGADAPEATDPPPAEPVSTEVVDVGPQMPTSVNPDFPEAEDFPGLVTPDSPQYDLEVLYTQLKYDEGLRIARERLVDNPTDPTLIWMIVRFQFEIYELVDRVEGHKTKLAVYTELDQLVDRGLAAHPGQPHLLFAKGMALGRLGTTKGVLASLFSASTIESVWLQTIESGYQYGSILGAERLPCDAQQALAVFYRLVPDWWIVQALAGTRGDLVKAVKYANDSHECHHRQVIRSAKELGVAEMCLGYKTSDEAMMEKGREHIRYMKTLHARMPSEFIDLDQADAILSRGPQYACEYSRDGQQDLDRAKLKE